MGLVKILESRGVSPRQDIADALSASNDMMYPGQQSELYSPQLVYAAQWAEANCSDKVLLMGWSSLGKRALGGPILGMFIVSESKFCFVRKGQDDEDIAQVYDLGSINDAKEKGLLGLRDLHFVVDGKEHKLERVQKNNAKSIVRFMEKAS